MSIWIRVQAISCWRLDRTGTVLLFCIMLFALVLVKIIKTDQMSPIIDALCIDKTPSEYVIKMAKSLSF